MQSSQIFLVNGYNVFSCPYIKIYKLLKENKINELPTYYSQLSSIYNKLSQNPKKKEITIHIHYALSIFKYFNTLQSYKKRLSSYLNSQSDTNKIKVYFIYFYTSIEKFCEKTSSKSISSNSKIFCAKIINNYLKPDLSNFLENIFELSLIDTKNKSLQELFIFFVNVDNTNFNNNFIIKKYIEHLYNRFVTFISASIFRDELFSSLYNENNLNKIYDQVKRTLVVLETIFLEYSNTDDNKMIQLNEYILEHLIDPIFIDLHTLLKSQIDREDYPISKLPFHYQLSTQLENYFNTKFSPISFSNRITNVFKEKINIDYLEYEINQIKNYFEDFVPSIRKQSDNEDSLWETCTTTLHFFSKIFETNMKIKLINSQIYKIWDKEIFIEYANKYLEVLVEQDFDEDISNDFKVNVKYLFDTYKKCMLDNNLKEPVSIYKKYNKYCEIIDNNIILKNG